MPIILYWDGLTRGDTKRVNAYCMGMLHAGCGRCNSVLFYPFCQSVNIFALCCPHQRLRASYYRFQLRGDLFFGDIP